MREEDWAKSVKDRIHSYVQTLSGKYAADVGRKLCYANEVRQYRNKTAECQEVNFETDILLYEWVDDEVWKPRVVIEAKVGSVTTHDAITHSKKAQNHRAVHPFLRYGMFLGNMGEVGVPARVLRHGENFDFMISWASFRPNETEWDALCKILKNEIEASQVVEETLFNNRTKDRERYFAYHRPLVAYRA